MKEGSESKKRYTIPAKILELLYSDDGFFYDVMKIKKVSSNSKFPKSDEWRDEDGFNISFALAGYSPSDVTVESKDNILIVKGTGMDSIKPLKLEENKKSQNEFEEYTKTQSCPRVHIGTISRGIARRKFCVKYLISEEFDVLKAQAKMEYGLLHVYIPERKEIIKKVISIENGK